jgi:hypothetical protein
MQGIVLHCMGSDAVVASGNNEDEWLQKRRTYFVMAI